MENEAVASMFFPMNKLRFVVFVSVFLMAAQSQAYCNLERVGFGNGFDEAHHEFDETGIFLGDGQLPRAEIAVPGELACKGDSRFEGILIRYVFLYGKLVEISMSRVGDRPLLLDWAESMYGKKQKKPDGFVLDNTGEQFVWDTFSSVIAYSFSQSQGEKYETVVLQSRRHADYFAKYFDQVLENGSEGTK
jgi:hypothetical protein